MRGGGPSEVELFGLFAAGSIAPLRWLVTMTISAWAAAGSSAAAAGRGESDQAHGDMVGWPSEDEVHRQAQDMDRRGGPEVVRQGVRGEQAAALRRRGDAFDLALRAMLRATSQRVPKAGCWAVLRELL